MKHLKHLEKLIGQLDELHLFQNDQIQQDHKICLYLQLLMIDQLLISFENQLILQNNQEISCYIIEQGFSY